MSAIMNSLIAKLSMVGKFDNRNAMSETIRDIMIGRDMSMYKKYVSPDGAAPEYSSPFWLNGNDDVCYLFCIYSKMLYCYETKQNEIYNHFGIYSISERVKSKGKLINEDVGEYEEGGVMDVLQEDMKGELHMWHDDEYVISGDTTNHAMDNPFDINEHINGVFNEITEYRYFEQEGGGQQTIRCLGSVFDEWDN